MPRRPPPQCARDVMKTHVLTFRPNQDILDACEALLRHGFSGAPVVDEEERVVGVLSEADCLRVLANSAFHDLPGGTVSAFMTRDVETVPVDLDVYSLTTFFRDGRHRRVPVVHEGRLVGLVTRHDLMRSLDHLSRIPREARPTTYELIESRR